MQRPPVLNPVPNPKVSIIIPVFNVEKYLEKCLESAIRQTLTEIEIIVIDNGSSDESFKIAQKYQQLDCRIILIKQDNLGVSCARNEGLKIAKGEYIGFLDSDDWVDLDYFEKLYNAAKANNSDIAAASALRYREKSQKYRLLYQEEKLCSELSDKIKICNIPKCCYIWNKIYKKELISGHYFKEGAYFEDILWLPEVIKKANSITTVPDTKYYYRVRPNSIVKQYSDKKQSDSFKAKKYIVDFFDENNLELNKKERNITRKIGHLGKFVLYKIKEKDNLETTYLFGFLPIFRKKAQKIILKDNSFIVWEPCSKSHSEVVPGYAKYLVDLGYHVSIIVHPDRYKEGLFSKFDEKNVSYNVISPKEIKKYFKKSDLSEAKGLMVTTIGKLCDCVHYEQTYSNFAPNVDKSKILMVEHEASFAADKGLWREKNITLRALNYKGAKSVVVNPHYFGKIQTAPKNEIANFVTIGAIKPNKKNSSLIIDAVEALHNNGIHNFKVTVIGKGHLKGLSKEIRQYFDIKGRLPFNKMYDELEKADFMLSAYDDNDKEHIRYNTSGTSGNFQLVYGFLKPCIIVESFAPINDFNNTNSIMYKTIKDYPEAMERAIKLSSKDYLKMQMSLKETADKLYQTSLNNLENLINNPL